MYNQANELKAFGYAPGSYEIICMDCKEHKTADKLAIRCYVCALVAINAVTPSPVEPPQSPASPEEGVSQQSIHGADISKDGRSEVVGYCENGVAHITNVKFIPSAPAAPRPGEARICFVLWDNNGPANYPPTMTKCAGEALNGGVWLRMIEAHGVDAGHPGEGE